MKLFPAEYPLEDVAMDLIGPLPVTTTGKRYIFVVMDRFSNFTSAVLIKYTTATHIASLFMNHWVFPYGVPQTALTENRPQFIAEFFELICATMGVKQITLTA